MTDPNQVMTAEEELQRIHALLTQADDAMRECWDLSEVRDDITDIPCYLGTVVHLISHSLRCLNNLKQG